MQTANAKSEEISLALANSQGALYAYIFLRLGDPDAVDDVLQETNRYIWRNIDHLDSPANFLPWARTLALFQVKRYLKTRGRERGRLIFDSEALDRMGETLPAPVPSEEPASAGDGMFAALRHCVGKLPPEKRRLLDRRYGDRDSVFKIAVEELKTPTAVSVALHRIREQLRDCIRNFACRMGEDAAPGTGEAVRARFFERVFDAAPGARPALARALKDDPSLLREWADQGDIHAQLLFYADRLRLAAPPAVSARSSLRRIAALVVVGLAIGLAVFATTVAAIEKIGNQKTETGMTVRAETEKQTPGTSTTIVTAEGRAGGPSRAAGVRSTLSSTSSSSASSALTQENTAMNTHALTNTLAAAASTVTLAVATPIAAQTAWTYNATDQTITDGNWVLNVAVLDTTARTLSLGQGYRSGSGTLDMDGGIVADAAGGADYTITGVRSAAFWGQTAVTNLILPPTLTTLENASWRSLNLTNLVLRAPNLTSIGDWCFYQSGTTLTNVDVFLPALCSVGSDAFSGLNGARMDAAAVVPSCLTNIGASAYQDCQSMTGSVCVTNLMSLGPDAFKWCSSITGMELHGSVTSIAAESFQGLSVCSNLVIDLPLETIGFSVFCWGWGGGYVPATNDAAQVVPQSLRSIGYYCFYGMPMTGTVSLPNCTNLGSSAFQRCKNLAAAELTVPEPMTLGGSCFSDSGIRNLTIGATNAAAIVLGDANVFSGCALTNVVFWGGAPAQTNLDKVLTAVAANNATSSSGEHGCVLRVSRHQAGWPVLVAGFEGMETAAAKPAGCVGVYVTADGQRKAWVVYERMPYDGAGGFVIRICMRE